MARRGFAVYGLDWSGEARYGMAKQGFFVEEVIMALRRQPLELWRQTRLRVWERDGRSCKHCQKPLALTECHIDHIRSGRLGTNHMDNLRVLCRRCHVLRADSRHRGMIAKALRDEIIPPNWRELVWDE